jgi:hypothetical protein
MVKPQPLPAPDTCARAFCESELVPYPYATSPSTVNSWAPRSGRHEAGLDPGEGGRLAGVVEPLAVDQDQHPVRGEAADHGPAPERAFALDLHPWDLLEQVGHLLWLGLLDHQAVDHRDRRRRVGGRLLLPGSGHHDLLAEGAAIVPLLVNPDPLRRSGGGFRRFGGSFRHLRGRFVRGRQRNAGGERHQEPGGNQSSSHRVLLDATDSEPRSSKLLARI